MKSQSEKEYDSRASIGVGASLGAVVGALLTEVFVESSLLVTGGSLLGAVLGGIIGSRIKSEAYQYLWIEYSKAIAIKLFISGSAFVGLMLGAVYSAKRGVAPTIQILLMSAAALAFLALLVVLGQTIAQLDDLLKKILLESLSVGLGLSLFVFMILGLFNIVYPIQADWLLAAVIMMGAVLVGRVAVAWKYR
ncbi:hypothetical protein ACFLZW_04915 [Chloroflexota bacterium]